MKFRVVLLLGVCLAASNLFGQAQTGLTNARFGLLGNTQTNDPRNTQVALKISF